MGGVNTMYKCTRKHCPRNWAATNQNQVFAKIKQEKGKKKYNKIILTRRPASLLCKFINILAKAFECLGWFFSLSLTSTKAFANLYPYSILSPHPPQIKSLFKSFGLMALLQPQLANSPSRHDLLIECTTPAADMAWVKAASLLAVRQKKMGTNITRIETKVKRIGSTGKDVL